MFFVFFLFFLQIPRPDFVTAIEGMFYSRSGLELASGLTVQTKIHV